MKRLLVVDDEPHVARVLRVSLAKDGWSVETARDGAEALRAIANNPPDVMITDIQMPGMGGEELCRELHASLPHRPFPILVMTSMTARDQRDWARDLGSIEFLEKPVSPRRIAALLAQLLSQEKHNA
ncbi:response regulator [Zoogloea sp.]|jgi:CheY-like chemotaxis protein|uniref:response regulator n=1 Tax=Zoogloea sp. TaxID=49181 RepID=UPI0011D605BE|nr:response regulator [Zoogloea sp.]TXG88534.1 MAG: response regulator [Zoogloea sp.]HOY02949.1 response regulator [Zoogloea sp.]HPI60011.1 response regulator [Zoogloea sp.]